MGKEKTERNHRIYVFSLGHPNYTVRSIAKVFRISHSRVVDILKREKERAEQETSESTAGPER